MSHKSTPRSLLFWLERLTLWCFHGLVLTVPFIFTWVNEELFEFNKMLLTYAWVALIAGLVVARMIVAGQWLIKRTPFDWVMGGFVISQLLSTLFSLHPYTSWFGYYTRFHGGLLSTLTYTALFYLATATLKKKQVLPLVMTLLIGAFGVALYAIPEHFGHSPSCLLISAGREAGVGCWVQDVKTRVFATFGQPNWLAAYVVMLMPLTWGLLAVVPTLKLPPRFRLGLMVGLGATSSALFLTLLFTKSRSGFLALMGGLVVYALGWGWLQWRQKTLAATHSLVLTLAIYLLAAAIFGTPYSPSLDSLISPPPAVVTPTTPQPVVNRLDTGGTDSGEIRRIVWTGAYKIWQRYPILGSGVETFAYSYYLDRPAEHNIVSEWDFLYNKAHNEFLNFLATTGLVGLASYLALLGWYGWLSARFIFRREGTTLEQQTLLALAAGVVALSISNFFGFSTVMVTVCLYLFLAFFTLLSGKDKPEATQALDSHPPQPLKAGQLVGLTSVVLAVLYLLISIWNIWMADYTYTLGRSYLGIGEVGQGLPLLQQAAQLSPKEGLFVEEISGTYAALAVQLASAGEATAASTLAQTALMTAEQTLALNPHHLNFHKNYARVLITLSQLEPKLLEQAELALLTALEKSPTDAKIMYNLGIVQTTLEKTDVAVASLEKAISLKPNYDAARIRLAELYESQGKITEAKAQYTYILTQLSSTHPQALAGLARVNAATPSSQVVPPKTTQP